MCEQILQVADCDGLSFIAGCREVIFKCDYGHKLIRLAFVPHFPGCISLVRPRVLVLAIFRLFGVAKPCKPKLHIMRRPQELNDKDF